MREGKSQAPKASKRLLVSVAAAALALGAAASFLALRPRGLSVGLGSLSSAETSAYRAALKGAPGVASVELLPAGAALSARTLPDAVVGRMGAAFLASSDAFGAMPSEELGRVPPSLGAAVLDAKGRAFALPLQLDQFQVAYSYERLAKAGVKVGQKDGLDLAGLSKALAAFKDPRAPALLFAGGDDETLLLLFSALCESRGGAPAYEAMVRAVRKNPDLGASRAVVVGKSPAGAAFTMGDLIDEIRAWRSKGYLHVEWYSLKDADVLAYMKSRLGYVMLGTLSFRRSVPYEVIDGFGWGSYPALPGLRDRAFVAPLTVLAFRAKSMGGRTGKARGELLENLASPATALKLAEGTGRATAIAAARAPDLQAADALAWAAGSRVVVNGLYRDAFASVGLAHGFAESLRDFARK